MYLDRVRTRESVRERGRLREAEPNNELLHERSEPQLMQSHEDVHRKVPLSRQWQHPVPPIWVVNLLPEQTDVQLLIANDKYHLRARQLAVADELRAGVDVLVGCRVNVQNWLLVDGHCAGRRRVNGRMRQDVEPSCRLGNERLP
eukprot:scaffold110674_cov118-Phaeocystis_antarctica.AAC.1